MDETMCVYMWGGREVPRGRVVNEHTQVVWGQRKDKKKKTQLISKAHKR